MSSILLRGPNSMGDYFHQAQREVMRVIMRMDVDHWLIVFGVLVAIGVFCMRGFGSRTSY
ncbi:MAG: hypothetical protein KY475_24155 [Planctomycetes bacterium]|nr:hypothetical protein [Planctomycetota bacterium]